MCVPGEVALMLSPPPAQEDRWTRIQAAALAGWKRQGAFVLGHAAVYTAVYATVRTSAWSFLLRSSWGLLM